MALSQQAAPPKGSIVTGYPIRPPSSSTVYQNIPGSSQVFFYFFKFTISIVIMSTSDIYLHVLKLLIFKFYMYNSHLLLF